MKYKGSRLKEYVRTHRGMYTDLCVAMLGGKKKGLDNYYRDDKNIMLDNLTALLKATGKSVDFFVEFEPGELPTSAAPNFSGNNNIINSMVGNDLTAKVEHLSEIITLKDKLISEKEKVILLQANEIELWKKRYDDIIKLANSRQS